MMSSEDEIDKPHYRNTIRMFKFYRKVRKGEDSEADSQISFEPMDKYFEIPSALKETSFLGISYN